MFAVSAAPALARQTCPPAGYSREALLELKRAEWVVADEAKRSALARGLVLCLASPDPSLRDDIAFGGIQTLLRARALDAQTMTAMEADLRAALTARDRRGFRRPFAALALSEIARADRIAPFLTDETRRALLRAGADYLKSVDDYRGFSESEGWRHGVAHGADLMLQLALNPLIDQSGLETIRVAVASQIGPGAHAYVFGESKRLARPILVLASRKAFDQDSWRAWLKSASDVGSDPYSSLGGLTKLHNVSGFLAALHIGLARAEPGEDSGLKALVDQELGALP
jgi:hypothetical protein